MVYAINVAGWTSFNAAGEVAVSCGHGVTKNSGSVAVVTTGYDAAAPSDDDNAVSD